MAVSFPTTYLLIFNNAVYESADSSGISFAQEPFPTGGPNGAIALATTAAILLNGWILDGSATLWQRVDQKNFVRLVTGDLFPNAFDFYTYLSITPPSVIVAGDIGQLPSPRFVKSTDGGQTVQMVPFPAGLFPVGSTFMRFWADQRTGANFLAQVRDSSNVDHLYFSTDLLAWIPLTVSAAPLVQASLLMAGVDWPTAPTSSQFAVGPTDRWVTLGGAYGLWATPPVSFDKNLLDAKTTTGSPVPMGADSGGPRVGYTIASSASIGGMDGALIVMGLVLNPLTPASAVPDGIQMNTTAFDTFMTAVIAGKPLLVGFKNMQSLALTLQGGQFAISWHDRYGPLTGAALLMIIQVANGDGTYLIANGGLYTCSGQGGSPVTCAHLSLADVGFGTSRDYWQPMAVLTDGSPADVAPQGSFAMLGTGSVLGRGHPNPIGTQATATILDFIRTQAGTFLVAVERAPTTGTPAIARSMDAGVTWTFTTLGLPPNAARPTPGLTECDDGTVLVPTDGSAGSGFVFRSTDDGQTFQTVQLAPPAVTVPANVYLKYFPVINTLFAYVSHQAGGTGTTVQTAVYLSTDQGQSWRPAFISKTSAPLPQQSTSWMALTQRTIHWGVDSLTQANSMYPVSPGVMKSLFDIVTDQAQGAPAFWGRYIGLTNGLTQPEVDFLHSRNCRVLLIYNGTYVIPPGQSQPRIFTYADGQYHATQAMNYIASKGLTVPGGKRVWIYLDTETPDPTTGQPPAVTADFLRGWSDTMFGSIYGGAGGVYGNTDPLQNFDAPYCAFYNDPSLSPEQKAAGAFVYTNQPNKACKTLASQAPPFNPTIPPQCNPPIVIYQYSINCPFSQGTSGTVPVDLDLANGAGFGSMW